MRLGILIHRANRITFYQAAALALCLLAEPMAAQAVTWKQFRSPGQFSIVYPANWFGGPNGRVPGWIFLLNEKDTLPDILFFLRPKEAMIEVMPMGSGKPLQQLVDEHIHGRPPDSRKPLSVVQKDLPATDGCERLKELAIKDYDPATPEPIPKGVTPKFYTDIFCAMGGRIVRVSLQTWSNDKRIPQYQQIVLQMAQSIRVLH